MAAASAGVKDGLELVTLLLIHFFFTAQFTNLHYPIEHILVYASEIECVMYVIVRMMEHISRCNV